MTRVKFANDDDDEHNLHSSREFCQNYMFLLPCKVKHNADKTRNKCFVCSQMWNTACSLKWWYTEYSFFTAKKKIPRDKFIGCVYLLFWRNQNTNFKINWMHTVRVRFNDISRKYISSHFTSLPEKKIHHTRILKFRKVFLSDFITRKYVEAILEM